MTLIQYAAGLVAVAAILAYLVGLAPPRRRYSSILDPTL